MSSDVQVEVAVDPLDSRRVVEWDWVVTKTSRVLHCPTVWDDPDYLAQVVGETACGFRGRLYIPGVFSRMTLDRCERCCIKVEFPSGMGSPKNDDGCRPLVERRMIALGLADGQ